MQLHFRRELLRANKIDVQFVASEEQHADILNKARAAIVLNITIGSRRICRWSVSKGSERYNR